MCKCEEQNCLGFVLLHEKELFSIEKIKQNIITQNGELSFELKLSPSSGEVFNKFYELHART